MWSPKAKSDGGRLEYYDNMTKVGVGDIVFSYRGGALISVGIVQSRAYSSPKPSDFGVAGAAWSAEGWCVDLEYHEVSQPLRPKLYIDSIRPLLPSKYSPLQANGNGNQVYLCGISDELGEHLVNLIGTDAVEVVTGIDVDVLREVDADHVEECLRDDDSLRVTEKNHLAKSRRGQGLFRSRLERLESRCRITGVSSGAHLRASHIKPWAKSTNQERLDGSNGLLLSPHVDHLFDRGYISFTDSGDMIVSDSLEPSVLESWALPDGNAGGFTSAQRVYLKYHREYVLR